MPLAISHQPLIAALAVSAMAVGQISVDRETVAKIRAEGLAHSQVEPVFNELTIAIGPRLTASPAHKRAVEYVRERLAAQGAEAAPTTPEQFAAFIQSEIPKYARIVKVSGAKVD